MEQQGHRALITGITGQDGIYLAKLLINKGYQVYGLIRGQNNPKQYLVSQHAPAVHLIAGDLQDPASLARAIETAQPSEIYNLGAISHVAYSWGNPHITSAVTGLDALNMLEAARSYDRGTGKVRFYQASSSEMFGAVQADPQDEITRFWPRSPYGVAKVFAHHMAVNYRESYGLQVSCGILFNHESPLRGPEFVTRKITRAVARIAQGSVERLNLGNLNAVRDWGFAGDYVDAMWRMLQHDVSDDFVVATGESHSVRDFLTSAFQYIGIRDWGRHVSQDQLLLRPAEVDLLRGSAAKAKRDLGWRPTVSFSELVAMMVDADCAALRHPDPGLQALSDTP